MFDFPGWIETFKEHFAETGTAFNDAEDYGVVVSDIENALYNVIGVHHLTPPENQGERKIFIDVLCKPSQPGGPKRIMNAVINWVWKERAEPDLPQPVLIGKPPNEIADLPIFDGMKINIWHPAGNGAVNLHAMHPDELGPNGEIWNSWHHHSFLVVFQQAEEPGWEPPPDPDPDPPPVLVGGIKIIVSQAWVATLTPDPLGNVTFVADIHPELIK